MRYFDGYTIITLDGGDISGTRQPNVVVDIGYGDREYWAYTNEYDQLVKVTAKKIILQDDTTEPVKSNGRYYNDEANVPGTELSDYDQGHVIADSLGGVSNAYNITPQDSTLNRHGDQAYMEKSIRGARGCTDFEAVITYPDTTTQIPSHSVTDSSLDQIIMFVHFFLQIVQSGEDNASKATKADSVNDHLYPKFRTHLCPPYFNDFMTLSPSRAACVN